MKSFVAGFLEKQRIPQNLLRTIRLLGEYKGKEDVFKQQSPQVLETLRQTAMIQSTESSNRIEGEVAPHDRIVKIVQKKLKPSNRSEQEIAGYRDVLNTIHANHAHMKFSVKSHRNSCCLPRFVKLPNSLPNYWVNYLNSESHGKFQVMAENCRKISRYAGQEFHLMPESSA